VSVDQKLLKGKGVNFFRSFKAQGLNTMNESLSSISPLDCRINFSVPSNPTLSKETSKYTLDAGSPGLLNIISFKTLMTSGSMLYNSEKSV
jgi:hypothetical protein